MARETKVGLLIGLCVILLIGIIVSDQLAVMKTDVDPTAGPDALAVRSEGDIPADPGTPPGDPGRRIDDPQPAGDGPVRPVATPTELDREARRVTTAMAVTPGPSPTPGPGGAHPTEPYTPGELTLGERVTVAGDNGGRAPAVRPGARILDVQRDIVHTVEYGEDLPGIARHYYGNADYWKVLAFTNRDTVDRNWHVRPGAVLTIPNRAGLIREGWTDAAVARMQLQRETPIRVDADADAARRAAAAGGQRTVTVESGDTLSAIARAHLGSEGKWTKIFEANRDQLDRPEDLRPGMKLRLPAEAAPQPEPAGVPAAGPPAPRRAVAAAAPPPARTVVVEPGDNLSKIAARTLGDPGRWDAIYQANRDQLDSPDQIVAGQTLKVPVIH